MNDDHWVGNGSIETTWFRCCHDVRRQTNFEKKKKVYHQIDWHNSLWFLSHNWYGFVRRDCVIAIQEKKNKKALWSNTGHDAKLLNYCVAWNNQCLINTQFMMNILRGGSKNDDNNDHNDRCWSFCFAALHWQIIISCLFIS